MPDYDFKNLSPWEFEQLSRDLLRAATGLDFELFMKGRDSGIDLRYAPTTDGAVIAQCKHYAGSKFSNLVSDLKNSELPKIRALNPSRYILVTSLPLSPQRKNQIIKLLDRYITSPEDIVSNETLNSWLRDHPSVERSHINLWAPSTAVVERILHAGIFSYSEYEREQLEKKLNYYVKNASFDEAKIILNQQRFCVIAGIPGIGKTTLAEMLLVDYMQDGFTPVRISSDIVEAFNTLDSSTKRIYYYDDFLGQTALEEKLNKNEDQRIIDFCAICAKSKNLLFVLTTREYILNQAKSIYEKLSTARIDFNKCVIDITKYALLDRGQILYNHLYHGGLPHEYKMALLKDYRYLEIIKHPSFNPRVIEWTTDFLSVRDVAPENYFAEFIARLSNPSVIWSHAFENQIADVTRHLLIVMQCSPRYLTLQDSERIFEQFRILYSDQYSEARTPGEFARALKESEGNFLRVELIEDAHVLQFHNPSIRDFLTYFLASQTELVRISLRSALFFDQPLSMWNAFEALEDNPLFENDELREMFQKRLASLIGTESIAHSIYRTYGGKLNVKKATKSSADHCRFILTIDVKDPCSDLKETLNQRLSEIFSNLNRHSDWSGVVTLLKLISEKSETFGLSYAEYLEATLEVFPKSLHEASDYRYLADLCAQHPGAMAFLSPSYERFISELDEALGDEISYIVSVDDLGTLEQCLSDVKRVTQIFGGDLHNRIEEMSERIRERLDQDWEDEPTKVPSGAQSNIRRNDEENVIALFETLD